VLELAYRADSNSAAREGLWVRVPPAVPGASTIECLASPPDPAHCLGVADLHATYPYLLGLYLGDGMLSLGRRGVWRLRVTLDARYPAIIQPAAEAIAVVSGRRVGHVARPGCIEVNGYWKHWLCILPQHGIGPKHTRPIRLRDWQVRAIESDPRPFVAGLLHSDGSRCINRVKGRGYPRYFFSNLSSDIRDLFGWACALLGIEYRADGPRNVSVARRASVAKLDAFVGPKR